MQMKLLQVFKETRSQLKLRQTFAFTHLETPKAVPPWTEVEKIFLTRPVQSVEVDLVFLTPLRQSRSINPVLRPHYARPDSSRGEFLRTVVCRDNREFKTSMFGVA